MKPRALDLFCGAGGATKGLQMAGFHVTGIDIKKQPRYCGDVFIQADALRPPVRLGDFDLVWASPPCQGYTTMANRHGRSDIRLIADTRRLLEPVRFSVIENVPGARNHLRSPMRLMGEMFGLRVHRARLFEVSGFYVMAPKTGRQHDPIAVYGDADGRRLWSRKDGTQLRAWRTLKEGQAAMEMPWADKDGVREAIPPAYSKHIGEYALMALESASKKEDAQC